MLESLKKVVANKEPLLERRVNKYCQTAGKIPNDLPVVESQEQLINLL